MRKPLFYNFWPLIFASKIDKNSCFFQAVSWTSFFSFFLNCFKNNRFGDSLQNPMGSKMVTKSTKWRQNVENVRCPSWTKTRFFSNPVFTKPWCSLCRWDIVALKRSFVRCRLANVLFSLRFFVHCFIQHV